MIQYWIIFLFQLFCLTGATGSGIVGGKVAKPHSRPYMVSLQVERYHICGGILIRNDFVLTSAHCKTPHSFMAVLGAHDRTKKEKSQQSIPVAKSYQHPKYAGQFLNDIMLLKLKTNATLNKYVKTIGLPKKNGKTPANIKCSVAGWGQTGPNKEASPVLKEAVVKVQFDDECRRVWHDDFSKEQMMCTHSSRKKEGICQGDSGGPLVCNNKPQGISAFTKGDACDDPKFPHVFMKISYFIPWIKKVMQG